jgi:hypothetical protein
VDTLNDVREAHEGIEDSLNRPDILYLHGVDDHESDGDEDVEMSDAGEEGEDDQVVAEEYVRFHL